MKKIIPIILFPLWIWFLYTCPATAATQTRLTGIQFESPSRREDRIIFTFNGIIRPKIFEIKGKRPRVVIDLPDTGLALWLKNTTKTNGHFVRRIRLGMHKGKHPGTRLVLDLVPHQPIHFDQHFNRENNILIISIYPAGGTTKPAAAKAQAQVSPAEKPGATISSQAAVRKSAAPAVPQQAEQNIPESVFPGVPAPGRKKQTAVKPLSPAPTGQLRKPAMTGSMTPVIKSIEFDNRSSRGEIIRFQLNGFYPPTVMGLEKNAPCVGCNFKNATTLESVKKFIECNGKYVKTIQVEQSHNPDKVRVVLNLVPGHKYDLQQIFFKHDNLFVIIINTVNTSK